MTFWPIVKNSTFLIKTGVNTFWPMFGKLGDIFPRFFG